MDFRVLAARGVGASCSQVDFTWLLLPRLFASYFARTISDAFYVQIDKHPSFAASLAKVKFRIFFLGIGVAALIWLCSPLFGQNQLIAQYGAIFLAASAFNFLWAARRAHQGDNGEERIEKELSVLDDRYTHIRNWVPPGAKGDVDQIVLGPFGALVIEAKTYSVGVKCEGDRWFCQRENGSWRPIRSFSSQLRGNVKRVQKHFKVPTVGVLVFNDRIKWKLEGPTVNVIRRKELLDLISSLEKS